MRALLALTLFVALGVPALASAAASGRPEAGHPLGGKLLPAPLAADRLASQKPGSWIEYVATLDGKPVGSYLRYVYAGRTEEGLWLELWLSSRPGSAATAFRILLEADGAGALKPKRAWQRLLGGPVSEVELPEDEAVPVTTSRAEVEEASTTVMTRAGSFRARALSMREKGRAVARLYLVDSLPVFGLARMDLDGNRGIEVHAFGEGGRLVFGGPGAPEADRGKASPVDR